MSQHPSMSRPAGMSQLAGTRPLLRTSLRYEARALAPWAVFATALTASSALVYPLIFPTAADRAGLAAAIGGNPALSLIFGPAHDLSTVDGFTAWRGLALGGFIVALGAILTVVRASRGQEDSGQAELLASGVLGRASRLTAAIGMAFLMSLAAGVLTGLATGLCGASWTVACLIGATFTATGWMFAAVAAVTSQLGSDARTATAMAVSTLGALFILRGFMSTIAAPAWATWVNPLGWVQETRPAAGDHWAPLLLTLAFTAVVLAGAFLLQSRRDFGQGVIALRPGPARGTVRGPLALALRLNRGSLVSWTIAYVAIGIVFGYLTTSIQGLLSGDSALSQVLASGATTHAALIGSFLATILSLVGIIAAVSGVQTMVRVRSEELEDRVEPVMAGAIDRRRYFLANVAIAFFGPAVGVLVAGVVIAALASRAGIGVGFTDVALQALVTVPAVWTVVAVAVAVIGARPRVAVAAWLGVVLAFVLTLLGPTFRLPDWALAISPFRHVPTVTSGAPDWLGLVWVTLATLVLVAVGTAGFRRRDLAR